MGLEEKAAVNKLFDDAIAGHAPIAYNGAVEQAFCTDFADFMGGGFVDAVNSGTAAVYVALRALDLEPFTEVIVGPITDAGGLMPVPMINCIPVVPDTAPGQFNVGPEQIEEMISPLTSAIIIAHIGGEPVDIEGIMAIARRHDLPVIEDCAQAHSTRLNGRLVGTFGDIAAFSTMFGKHCCTGGQGGLVFTKDESLYAHARRVSDRGKPFGMPAGSTNPVALLNFNLNDLSAAIGREQLKKLPGVVRRRKRVGGETSEWAIRTLVGPNTGPHPGAEPSYWFLRLELDTDRLTCDKNTFCDALLAEGCPIEPSYRHMPHTFEWHNNHRVFGSSGLPWSSPLYKGDATRTFPCPNAMAATDIQFIMYIHEGWSDREITDAISMLKKVESAYLR